MSDTTLFTLPRGGTDFSDESTPVQTSSPGSQCPTHNVSHMRRPTDRSVTTSTAYPSTSFVWRPSRRRTVHRHRNNISCSNIRHKLSIYWISICLCLILTACLYIPHYLSVARISPLDHQPQPSIQQVLKTAPISSHNPSQKQKQKQKQKQSNNIIDPEKWLLEHSDSRIRDPMVIEHPGRLSKRPKAALISLVRNEELDGILQSMRQLEYHWNHRYRYPWMFFSEKPFSEEFKAATSNATTSLTSYHLIPRAHWSTPPFIDRTKYHDSLTYQHIISVGKAHLPSYRHMCRWNSGFFYWHPALSEFEYYWRIEPDVHFFCDIAYDPFRFMRDNEMVYGFNMNILDDARSFSSLWRFTRQFMEHRPELVHPQSDLSWLIDDSNGGEYNSCQFFSNFEIGSLAFFRGEANTAYFDFLDVEAGGFFYERYGDAPVHTLSVALFAPKDRVWFFRDIGYQHDVARHCPADGVRSGRCTCEPTRLDENFYRLVPMESPQRKPKDTCIRLWLGGGWLEKRDGWDQDAERLMGGDGYGGYVKDVV